MVQITLTIDIPRATIDAIRNPANVNRSVRAIADAMGSITPAFVAAVNNLPEAAVPIEREREYPDGFDIIIKPYRGQEYPVEIHNRLPAHELYRKVAAIQGISVEDTRLFFDGGKLGSQCAVNELKEGDVVDLQLALIGS